MGSWKIRVGNVKVTVLWKRWFHKIIFLMNFSVFHNNCTWCTVRENENLLSLKKISSNQLFGDFFSKTVTFTKYLPKMRESKFPYFPHCVVCWTVWKWLSPFFWQKFRESNISTKQITKWLIWRNIYTARVNFSFTFRTNFLWNSFTNQQWIILMKRFHEIFPNKRGLCIRDSKMFKVWVSNKWLNHEWVTDAQCVKLWKFSLTLFWQKIWWKQHFH